MARATMQIRVNWNFTQQIDDYLPGSLHPFESGEVPSININICPILDKLLNIPLKLESEVVVGHFKRSFLI